MDFERKQVKNNSTIPQTSNFFQGIDFLQLRAIPIDYLRSFDSWYRHGLGTFSAVAYISIFVYFVVRLFLEKESTSFIAVHVGNNRCSTVVKPVNNKYLASIDGVWEGSSNFSHIRSPFQFIFRDLNMTRQEFKEFLELVKTRTSTLNSILITHNLAFNLVVWMSARLSVDVKGSVQSAYLKGDPSRVFNAKAFHAEAVSSLSYQYPLQPSVCKTRSQTTFDVASSSLKVSYDSDDFCYETIPSNFLSLFVPESIRTIQIDMRSVVMAISYNIGAVQTVGNYYLEVVNSQIVYLNNTPVEYYELVDSRYLGMPPVHCANITSFCTIRIGDAMVLPIMNHWGDSPGPDSKYCDCDGYYGYRFYGDPDFTGDGRRSDWCNKLDLMVSFVWIGMYQDPADWIQGSANLAISVGEDYDILSFVLHNLTKIVLDNTLPDQYRIDTVQEMLGSTILFAIRVVDDMSTIISPNGFELVNGSCNSPVFPSVNWHRLAEVPPTALEEPYYKCYYNTQVVLLDSMGLGMALTDLSIRVLAYLLLPIVLLVLTMVTRRQVVDAEQRTLDKFVDLLHNERTFNDKDEGVLDLDAKKLHEYFMNHPTFGSNPELLKTTTADLFRLMAQKVYEHEYKLSGEESVAGPEGIIDGHFASSRNHRNNQEKIISEHTRTNDYHIYKEQFINNSANLDEVSANRKSEMRKQLELGPLSLRKRNPIQHGEEERNENIERFVNINPMKALTMKSVGMMNSC